MPFFIEAFSTNPNRPSFVSSKPYMTLKEAEKAREYKQKDFPLQDTDPDTPPTGYILFSRKAWSLNHAIKQQKHMLRHVKPLW